MNGDRAKESDSTLQRSDEFREPRPDWSLLFLPILFRVSSKYFFFHKSFKIFSPRWGSPVPDVTEETGSVGREGRYSLSSEQKGFKKGSQWSDAESQGDRLLEDVSSTPPVTTVFRKGFYAFPNAPRRGCCPRGENH